MKRLNSSTTERASGAYEKREIPEEDVQKILRAAIEAPTAGNMTLWSAHPRDG